MTSATLDQLKTMRLFGMHDAFQGLLKAATLKKYTHEEMMAHLVQSEWEDRDKRRIERLLKNAKFRYHATMADINYSHPRQLDKGLMLRLSSCEYIAKAQNVIFVGPTGVGKSYIASALGHQACLQGFKTFYASTYKLFSNLKKGKADGSYYSMLKKIEKQQVLILDDFGLKPMDHHARMALMEIIEDRHQKFSTIITTQKPIKHWHDIIGESTIADAILDRLVHSAHKIVLKGESLRKMKKKK